MIKFKPISDNQSYDGSSKTTKIKSTKSQKIRTPYSGVVTKIFSDSCNGYVEILHEIEGEKYRSVYCYIDNVIVKRGDIVNEGQVIGHTIEKDDDVIYSLYLNGKKVNPLNFFRNNKFKSNDSKSSLSYEKNKEPNYNQPKNKKSEKKSNTSSRETYVKDGNSGRLLSNLLLSPLNFVGNKLEKGIQTVKSEFKNLSSTNSKKDKEIDDESLNEELKRIKRLL